MFAPIAQIVEIAAKEKKSRHYSSLQVRTMRNGMKDIDFIMEKGYNNKIQDYI